MAGDRRRSEEEGSGVGRGGFGGDNRCRTEIGGEIEGGGHEGRGCHSGGERMDCSAIEGG